MDRIINIEILGRPLNITIILLMIVVFWFAVYKLHLASIGAAGVKLFGKDESSESAPV